jgi:hypothetical protein
LQIVRDHSQPSRTSRSNVVATSISYLQRFSPCHLHHHRRDWYAVSCVTPCAIRGTWSEPSTSLARSQETPAFHNTRSSFLQILGQYLRPYFPSRISRRQLDVQLLFTVTNLTSLTLEVSYLDDDHLLDKISSSAGCRNLQLLSLSRMQFC